MLACDFLIQAAPRAAQIERTDRHAKERRSRQELNEIPHGQCQCRRLIRVKAQKISHEGDAGQHPAAFKRILIVLGSQIRPRKSAAQQRPMGMS